MIVKSFVADTVAGALKMARTELGGDAVILKTRKLNARQQSAGGGKVEVTACLDADQARRTVSAVTPVEGSEQRPIISSESKVPVNEIVKKLDFLIDAHNGISADGEATMPRFTGSKTT